MHAACSQFRAGALVRVQGLSAQAELSLDSDCEDCRNITEAMPLPKTSSAGGPEILAKK